MRAPAARTQWRHRRRAEPVIPRGLRLRNHARGGHHNRMGVDVSVHDRSRGRHATRVHGRPVSIWRPGRYTIAAYIAFFLIHAIVLRNLPWTPFTRLHVADLIP
ncbi:hypothetical protein Cco03nite_33970 [Catellatospora coxensis]|uniref:Uncharacterized protein n=2 Tax=Catellatospora coxensis TaxID=310354 RepID=A0A8J3KUV1_9ACTN|nr:hypothetical protein Cco03nite_33970 [Catellatospora coxensis]